jgi:hypothetical protein
MTEPMMQLNDLFADSSSACPVGLKSAKSGEHSDGAAPFAAMVLAALRDSGTEIAPEPGVELFNADLAMAPDVVPGEFDVAIQLETDARSVAALADDTHGLIELAEIDDEGALEVRNEGLGSSATVIALGISGDSAGRPHIESRHIASESADVVLSEMRTIIDETPSKNTEIARPDGEIETRLDVLKISTPVASASQSAISSTDERDAFGTDEILDESLEQPVSGNAPRVKGPETTARESIASDSGRAHPPSSTTGQAPATGPSKASAPNPTSGADIDAPTTDQDVVIVEPDLRKAAEAATVSRSVNKQVVQPDGESEAPSSPTEKDGVRGKGVRSQSASNGERAGIPAEFRVLHEEAENGRSIAVAPEEFFETENVSVDEVSEMARPDGAVIDSTSDGRSVEGRLIPTVDFQSDRAGAPREVSLPRTVVSAAWLRAMMEQGLRIHNEPEGWNSVTMRLGEEDGTMTVRTRREDGSMAVQVAFSDPGLRVMAAQNVERLEAALRAQYDTAIDLSLSDSDTSPDDADRKSSAPDRSRSPITSDHDTRDVTRRSPWARNEWVV